MEVNSLSFSFEGRKNILNEISFQLEKGKIYALMGTNGSGKTTLFNIISGFLKPKSGDILFNGNDISEFSPYEINLMGIGRIFQDLRTITKLSVKENIILAMRDNPTDIWYKSLLPESLFNKMSDNLNIVADKIINDYFLNDVKDSLAGEISFGQQKLLTLACCAANGADLYLLDEPIAGINSEYMNIIGNLLLQLKKEEKTIFFIEHNTEFISKFADRILFLDQGEIRKYDNMSEMVSDEYVKEAYL